MRNFAVRARIPENRDHYNTDAGDSAKGGIIYNKLLRIPHRKSRLHISSFPQRSRLV